MILSNEFIVNIKYHFLIIYIFIFVVNFHFLILFDY